MVVVVFVFRLFACFCLLASFAVVLCVCLFVFVVFAFCLFAWFVLICLVSFYFALFDFVFCLCFVLWFVYLLVFCFCFVCFLGVFCLLAYFTIYCENLCACWVTENLTRGDEMMVVELVVGVEYDKSRQIKIYQHIAHL